MLNTKYKGSVLVLSTIGSIASDILRAMNGMKYSDTLNMLIHDMLAKFYSARIAKMQGRRLMTIIRAKRFVASAMKAFSHAKAEFGEAVWDDVISERMSQIRDDRIGCDKPETFLDATPERVAELERFFGKPFINAEYRPDGFPRTCKLNALQHANPHYGFMLVRGKLIAHMWNVKAGMVFDHTPGVEGFSPMYYGKPFDIRKVPEVLFRHMEWPEFAKPYIATL